MHCVNESNQPLDTSSFLHFLKLLSVIMHLSKANCIVYRTALNDQFVSLTVYLTSASQLCIDKEAITAHIGQLLGFLQHTLLQLLHTSGEMFLISLHIAHTRDNFSKTAGLYLFFSILQWT